MTNKLSLTFILIPLLLVIWLAGCGESDSASPTGQVLRGSFVLTKADGHQLMDVGGDHIDDPLIIRRVPHTYHYPDGTGCLISRENLFYMEAPMPLQHIRAMGTLELLPNQNVR